MDEVNGRTGTVDGTAAPQSGQRRSTPRRSTQRRWLRVALATVAVVAAAAALRSRLPQPHQVVAAVRSAQPAWLLLGSVAEGVSMSMFARQQMWLLRGFGVSTTIWRALAVSYSRSAIAISMPAGSAVSAGFAFRAFRQWGASREVAGTVMVLSGLLSALGLGLLYLFGFFLLLAAHPETIGHAHPVGTVLALVAAVALGAYTVWSSRRARADGRGWGDRRPADGSADEDSPIRRWIGVARRIGAATKAMPALHRRIALAFAVANWLADLGCLAAVAEAFDLPVSLFQLGTVYVVVQLVRQVPITPGGVGVIEASLLASLVAAGARQGPAAAVVLGYRLFSAWLIVPAGLFAWALLRRRQSPATG
ncbi:flippase-like domain-containing protein [Planosporangium thailandense]|uniref:Flippase-like domain-containing protein n=1 Tax=Planosporangium thailandense TaxID=765197 RepID=A0ABX0Y7U2_9ACTN|nr:YbhN family protein [Planosporangium thailandense]NJC73493.1 flippase-like domain-containing protein [Planosporangium thailandense]